MKKINPKIFIVVSMFISFMFVKFVPLDTSTPLAFSNSIVALVPSKVQQYIATKSKDHIESNQVITKVVQMTAPKKAQAKEKRIIIYKGKRLVIYSASSSDELPPDVLEYFYQATLSREAQNSIQK